MTVEENTCILVHSRNQLTVKAMEWRSGRWYVPTSVLVSGVKESLSADISPRWWCLSTQVIFELGGGGDFCPASSIIEYLWAVQPRSIRPAVFLGLCENQGGGRSSFADRLGGCWGVSLPGTGDLRSRVFCIAYQKREDWKGKSGRG